jgi:methylenetetrahydrofolate dehydrogenase (NADP+)/methenyltetrahydrofolate cyclohydrolase
VQSPLPSHIHAQKVFDTIHPLKDVDGFSAANITRLYSGDETGLVPCTPKGIIKIIAWYFVQKHKAESTKQKEGGGLSGKKVVVIGKSTIVGKPLTMMLLNAGATVTVCHSRTTDIREHSLQADIVIPAVGRKHLITADMVRN